MLTPTSHPGTTPNPSGRRVILALEELKTRAQWVCWRSEPRPGKEKPAKVPYRPQCRSRADTTRPRTWGSFDAARAAYRAARTSTQPYRGVGYVFSTDDPYIGIDLDACRDPETAEIAPLARDIIAELNSYTEISPSQTGVKIFVRGQLPCNFKNDNVEAYSTERFFTVTGQHLPGTPIAINDAQTALDRLYERYGSKTQHTDAFSYDDLDQGFIAWLRAHMNRLRDAKGLPYGCSKQLKALLRNDTLPASLGISASEKRALVVANLASVGYLKEEIYVLAQAIWAERGYDTKKPHELHADALRLLAKYPTKKTSDYSIARYNDYRRTPDHQRPQPAAAEPEPPRRRYAARVDDDVILGRLTDLVDAGNTVLLNRAERAAALDVHLKTLQRVEARLVERGAIRIRRVRTPQGRQSVIDIVHISNRENPCYSTSVLTSPPNGSTTPESRDEEEQCNKEVGINTWCLVEASSTATPAPVVPPACPPPMDAPHKTVSVPSLVAPDSLAALVDEAVDAHGLSLRAVRRYIAMNTPPDVAIDPSALAHAFRIAKLQRTLASLSLAALRRKDKSADYHISKSHERGNQAWRYWMTVKIALTREAQRRGCNLAPPPARPVRRSAPRASPLAGEPPGPHRYSAAECTAWLIANGWVAQADGWVSPQGTVY